MSVAARDTSSSRRPLDRVNGAGRIAGVDLARGLAVVGMFAAHLWETAPAWDWTDPATWTAIVDGRSSILFATLAGVSVGIVTGGAQPCGGERMTTARARLSVRAGLLFLIGLALIATGVPVYIILPAYAILFLLALPFTALPAGAVLVAAAGFALVMPFVQPFLAAASFWDGATGRIVSEVIGWNYPFTVWIAFVLSGLGLARAGIARLRVQLLMLGSGAMLAAVGYGLAALPISGGVYFDAVLSAEPHSSGLGEAIGSGGFAVAVLAACLLLCRVPAVRALTLPLRATGAMPLTAYTAQILVWAGIAAATFGDTSDLWAFRALEPFWPLTLGTIAACTAWTLFIGRGPLEAAVAWIAREVVRGVRS